MKLRNVLQEVTRREEVQSNIEYNILGVRWYAKGLFVKDVKKGSEIQANYIYKVNKGDFVYSRLFAWKGSFAIVTEEFDGCYVSNEFPCFLVNKERINIEYLMWFFNQPQVWDNCLENSEGSTAISRNRLKVDKFLNMVIPLPSIENQGEKVGRLESVNQRILELLDLKNDSEKHINVLRQSILQEAVQGKLVPQDSNDEPACVLLEKIKAQKDQLVKEKKIKKEKLFLDLTEDEIPLVLPNGWEWVRLGEVVELISGQHVLPDDYNINEVGIPYLTGPADFSNKGVIISRWTPNPKVISIKGDILITVKGSGVGKLVSLDLNEAAISRQLMAIRNRYINSEFVYLVLKASSTKFLESAKGIAIPGISREDVLNLVVALPPLSEQKRIVEKTNELMALCDDLEKTAEQSKWESEKLIQSVLQETFSETERVNNIVEFQVPISSDVEEEWDMVARAEDISPETQAEIADILKEIKRDR